MKLGDLFIPYSFMGCGCGLRQAKVVVLPVYLDSTETFTSGTGNAPERIIAASRGLEFYSPLASCDIRSVGVYTFSELQAQAESPSASADRIASSVGALLDKGKYVFTLGGEHSITIGCVQAYASRVPDLSVLIFDAHADSRRDFNGVEKTHATVSYWARQYVGNNRVVQVGVRSYGEDETPVDVVEPDIAAILSGLTDNVYVSLDVDVFKSSEIGMGMPEIGGLEIEQVMRLIAQVCAERNVVGGDLCELIPGYVPGQQGSEVAGATIVRDFIGMAWGNK